MREILYRGKSIENGKWIEGYYFKHNPLMVCFAEEQKPYKHYIMKDGVCDWNFEPPIEAIEIDPETVGEFTELTDINGKKIFEGDIVSISCTLGLIVCIVKRKDCGYIIQNKDYKFSLKTFRLEVIGNIYDNSALLEAKNEN